MTVRARSAWMWLGLLVPLAAGCECGVPIGNDDGDAGADARRPGARTDECGNGLDDDENGLVDDLCPCAPGETQRCFSGALASNEVGACGAGTQTCVAVSGSEWGDWGDSDCEGEVLPATEACDGSDADCDGAIDEGCPCTDGATRGCGDEFTVAPCMAGTQTCRGGSWSGCEGAIGPTADVCTDAIDNDCDGLVNELCACVPEPERCRDGVDNDCDGVTDEPECTPDWPRDAGVPLDANLDAARPDAGISECVTGTSCLGRPSTPVPFGPSTVLSGYGDPIALTVIGSRLFAAMTVGESGVVALHVMELAPDGAPLHDWRIDTNVSGTGARLETDGAELFLQYSPLASARAVDLRIVAIDPDSGTIDPRVTLETSSPVEGGMALSGGELGSAWIRDYPGFGMTGVGTGYFQRHAVDGRPLGAPVSLGAGNYPVSVARLGERWIVGARDLSTNGALYFVIEGDTVVSRVPLERPATACGWSNGARIVAGCDGALICWRDLSICGLDPHVVERCQTLDASGTLVGDSTLLFGTPRSGPAGYVYDDLLFTGSEYLLRTEYARTGGELRRMQTFVRFGLDGTLRDIDDGLVFPGYEYGDVVWLDGCAVVVMQGAGTTDTGFQPQIIRLCEGVCG